MYHEAFRAYEALKHSSFELVVTAMNSSTTEQYDIDLSG